MFARIDAVASQVTAAVFADGYTLKPRLLGKDVNAAAVPDPGRPEIAGVLGIYRDKPAPRLISNGYDRRTDQRPGLKTGQPEIEVDPRWAQPTGFATVKKDDLLVGPDGRTWRVSAREVDEMGRLILSVNIV